MPMTRRMRSPASDSRSGRISGIPPATDASKSRSTPASAAASKSSDPTLASSSLLAVTTGLPPLRASKIRPRAGSMPPITSTTTSIDGSATTAWASLVSTPPGRDTVRSRVVLRTATAASSSRRPVRASIAPGSLTSNSTSAPPTWPQPSRPTRTVAPSTGPRLPDPAGRSGQPDGRRWLQVEMQEVVVGLPPHDGTPPSVADEHHRQAADLVVVGGHRMSVGARHRCGQDVTDGDVVGDAGVPHDDVTRLAVLAHDRDRHRPGRGGSTRQERLVPAAVEDGARVVAHPAVDAQVGPDAREVL